MTSRHPNPADEGPTRLTSFQTSIQRLGARLDANPTLSILAYLLILALLGIMIVGGAVSALRASGLMPQRGTYTGRTLLEVGVIYAAVIGCCLLAVCLWGRWTGHKGFARIRLGGEFGMCGWGLLLGSLTQTLVFGLGLLVNWQVLTGAALSKPEAVINVLIMTVSSINAGVTEEVVFRGVIYSALRLRSKWMVAALVSSVLFSAMHFLTGSYSEPVVPFLIAALVIGIVFAWAREAAGSLWMPIGLHIAWDAAIGWLNLNSHGMPPSVG